MTARSRSSKRTSFREELAVTSLLTGSYPLSTCVLAPLTFPRSGQQFWLNYSIDHPIRAKALSVEFHVDGNRVDTQFPIAADGDGPPKVGPVKSSITSQYGKDAAGNVYRRDVFFTLVEKDKNSSSRPSSAAGKDSQFESAGLIECKVFRAEKTGEWSGIINPDEIPDPVSVRQVYRRKGLSHGVRMGACIPAAKTVRYTFKNLDPEDAPYAFFRFYYRSKKFFCKLGGSWSLTRPGSPIQGIPRPPSRGLSRKVSLYQSLSKGKEYLADRLSSRRAGSPDPSSLAVSTTNNNHESDEEEIHRLEAELGMCLTKDVDDGAKLRMLRNRLKSLGTLPPPSREPADRVKKSKGKEIEVHPDREMHSGLHVHEPSSSVDKDTNSSSDGRNLDGVNRVKSPVPR
ncbi:hypothetical protein BZA05DRAFT_49748 [Tricharina praecox]|uniref:uncharacterized protein n=1 Tax=Tricharina praecox TaxID=43433 RepID=UPI00221EFB9F|nr:uncharacterized protein BZA05DRAFT_49748 [Tricharina praecox]KAI5852018.1 hypothetical protein BZA05DRAFT_49748 [Tricharina praecox]